MLSQDLRVRVREILRGDDDIGVDIIAEFPDPSFDDHNTSSGRAILPLMAVAAATAGPAR